MDSLDKQVMSANKMKTLLFRFVHDTRGQDFLEWALIAGLVAAMAVAIMPGVARPVREIFCWVEWYLFRAGGTVGQGNCGDLS